MTEKACTLTEARERILKKVKRLPCETVDILKACGRVICEDIVLARDLPPSEISLRDGYSLSSKDLTAGGSSEGFELVGSVTAGDAPCFDIEPGTAAKIATGALLPGRADSVVPYENVKIRNHRIYPTEDVYKGQFVLKPGSIAKKGDIVVRKNSILTPMAVCSIVDCGRAFVRVVRKPRVGVVVTGNEVVEPDHRGSVQQVYSSNRYFLETLTRSYGGDTISMGICRDDENEIASVLKASHGCDCVVISGGTGKGEHDHIRAAWKAAGIKTVFDGVLMHPAKGTGCGWKDGTLYFSLSGNPLASGIAFVEFVSVVLLNFSGVDISVPPTLEARLTDEILVKKSGVPGFFWGKATLINSEIFVTPILPSGENLLGRLSEANCIITIENGRAVESDDWVSIQPICLGNNIGYLSFLS